MFVKIYYSTSVSGDQSQNYTKKDVQAHIAIMQKYGTVLTAHLGAETMKELDMGGKTHHEIFEEDQFLLQSCHLFIADITNASFGVGKMIGQASIFGKRILCLKFSPDGNPVDVSAMVDGDPKVSVKFYKDNDSYDSCIREFMLTNYQYLIKQDIKFKQLCIFLAGAPGSGKSTIAKKLSDKYKVSNISTGAVLREFVTQENNSFAQEVKAFMETGKLVPSDMMMKIVSIVLSRPECQMFGFVLDGYPPSMQDVRNLQKLKIKPMAIFCFECSDDTAISRQVSRAQRNTDKYDLAVERLKEYHQNIPNFLKNGNKMFKKSFVIKVDAEQDPDTMWNFVNNVVHNLLTKSPIQTESYFVVPPCKIEEAKSTRYHFHIDADNHETILDVVKKLHRQSPEFQGNIKIYPIHYLHLGPQTNTYATYDKMMNFHEIENASSEAFVTGRLGYPFDVEAMRVVLEIASTYDKKLMVEIEQYIGEWECKDGVITGQDFSVSEDDLKFTTLLDEFKCNTIQKDNLMELHHGFDIPKTNSDEVTPPIHLAVLVQKCKEQGFDNGGWFIFKNGSRWVYRSNEFSHDDHETCKKVLFEQSKKLELIIKEFGIHNVPIGSNIEIVHSIWSF